jgi:hypothetical protein
MPHDVLARVARRTTVVHTLRTLTWGLGVSALAAPVLFLAGTNARASVALAFLTGGIVAAITWRSGMPRRGLAAAAAAVERIHPSNNLIVTAEELHRYPDRARPWVRGVVERQADRHLAAIQSSSVIRLWSSVVALIIAVAAVLIAGLLVARPRSVVDTIARVRHATTAALSRGSVSTIRITIEPPGYTGRPVVRLENPTRLDVLEGSIIRFAERGSMHVRFGERTITGGFIAEVAGYFAIEQAGVEDTHLLPLIVTPDSVPAVRVDDPGKDLLLSAGGRTIPLKFSAVDDLELETMELRYTKVSGSGEQFEFQEGRLPITLDRVSVREWIGRGQLSLTDLRLEPGDSLVYRVVAGDRRPGDAGQGSSDTYFVEIAGPGQVALEGVDMPPDQERYALSQQMIVVKLERLRSRETSVPRAAVIEEAGNIAAEQRAVRANFIFLMGGHVEDEEVEAEQSHEIQEGRLENTARQDINTAIAHMTRVEQGLAAMSTAAALPPARLAVEALQRAFGRSRYLLRALAVRSRLDLSRRLRGDFARARDWHRDPVEGQAHPHTSREVFDRLLAAARQLGRGEQVRVDQWRDLAESALRVDPSAPFWQGLSRSISDLRNAEGRTALVGLERVIRDVSPRAQAESLPSLSELRRTPLSRAWQSEGRR